MRPVTRQELFDYQTYGDRRETFRAEVLKIKALRRIHLGGPGELGAALLVELEDSAVRAVRLAEWRDLPGRIYVRLGDRSQAFARFDARQVVEDTLSSVQFLKFACGGKTPVAVGTDFPPLAVEADLTEAQRRALAADLRD